MAIFTKEILEIFANCLSAVETGGQIYGNGRWNDITLQYTNSDIEHAITIGAYARLGVEAKALLVRIRKDYPVRFKALDTAGISADLDASDWSKYQLPSKTCAKAKAIAAIIGSTEGIAVQKTMLGEDVQKRADTLEERYNAHRLDALLHLVNIAHLGGASKDGPLKRIVGRISGEITLEKVRDSLLQDTVRNQVGAEPYKSRQRLMYEWLHSKVTPLLGSDGLIKNNNFKEDTTMAKTAQAYLDVWRMWLGYSEANGKFKQIIDLYNSVKPLPRGYAVQYSDEWCDTGASAAGIKAGIMDLIGRECGCEEHIKIFKSLGIWNEDGTITPKPGYIILYNWDQSTQPNDGSADHIGVVESVSNGQITCIECNKGEAVARRVLSVGNGYIRGYACPKYDSQGTASTPTVTTPTPSSGSEISRTVAWTGVVNTGTLNVRTWAGTENAQLKSYPSISQGTKVGVCDTIPDKDGDPWYFVKISGDQGDKYGFVSAAYITKQASSTPAAMVDDGVITKTPQWVGKVTADSLNVRTWVGVNNPTIKSWPQLGYGNLVDVCDVVNATDGSRWYYIRIDGRIYGFVHSAYIEKA